MKNIIIAAKNMNVGGVEKSLISLLNEVNPEEYSIDLLLLEDYGDFMNNVPKWVNVIICKEYASIKDEVNLPPLSVIINHLKNFHLSRGLSLSVAYLKSKLTGDLSYYYKTVFKKIPVISKQYDVAISYSSIISYLSWYVNYRIKADSKIGWIHFDISQLNVNKRFLLKLHKNMNKIYIVSKEAYDSFVYNYPELKPKCEVKYNIINEKEIKKLADEYVCDIKQEGITVIVTLGRLSPEKGQDIIPDVALRLKSKGYKFKWYLIGDGILRSTIEKRIKSMQLEKNVILVGTKTNPYPYLKQSDIYVQTSVHEGFCITLSEASVFDNAIIATQTAGAHEQLDGRKNTSIVKRNAENIENAICKYL